MTAPSVIKVLPEEVRRHISAHQIIERPESVVKELVENSLDAGARNIDIYLEDGGLKLIQVDDDGQGISPDNLELAVERFSTSKISRVEDLNEIYTYGFRGEGLFAIKECSKLRIISSQEGAAAAVSWLGQNLVSKDFCSRSKGTTVIVEELFWNVPARKKFLSSTQAEFRRVKNLVTAFAIANPEVNFSLTHNGSLVMKFCQSVDRFSQVFGDGLAFSEFKSDRIKVSALVGLRSLGHFGPRFIFVNKRLIWDRGIQKAWNEALAQFIKNDNDICGYVACFLNPREVDFNVHPNKMEVRFVNPELIFKTVYKCVSSARLEPSEALSQNLRPSFNVSFENKFLKPSRSAFNKLSAQPVPEASQPRPQSLFNSQPEPKFLGCTEQGFFIYSFLNEVWIVDPHAAEERWKYERIKEELLKCKDIQALLCPLEINVKLSEAAIEDLSCHGFSFDEVGRLTKCPIVILEALSWNIFDLKSAIESVSYDFEWDKFIFRLAAISACKKSFRLGDDFTQPEAIELGKKLLTLDHQVCPHGRPFKFVLKESSLQEFFQRN